jgi:hypothetical protein
MKEFVHEKNYCGKKIKSIQFKFFHNPKLIANFNLLDNLNIFIKIHFDKNTSDKQL